MIRAEAFDSIRQLPAVLWDSVAPVDFFFRRAFLEVMERSAVEEARYRYLALFEGGTAVGVAVLSRFVLRLDLLAGDAWVRTARRWLPSLLDIPVVCCGIPASFGQHHLHVTRPGLAAPAFECVDSEMQAWAEELGSELLLWKEWSRCQGLHSAARNVGYAVLPTLPDHRMAGLPAGIDAFVESLRSPYRRKYRTAALLMSGRGPIWRLGALDLEEHPLSPQAVPEFHRGYLRVLERTSVRLETYPEVFFHHLAAAGLGARTLRLCNRESSQALTALLIPCGGTLAFALVAKEHLRYDDGLYTLLLRCIVLYAIRKGFTEVRMGQTSSFAKCSVGARPLRLETYIRAQGRLTSWALRRFGTRLFPEPATPALRVFKGGPVDGQGAAGITSAGG